MVIKELNRRYTPVIPDNVRPAFLEVVCLKTPLRIPRPVGKVQTVVIGIQCTDERDGSSLDCPGVLAQAVWQSGKHVEKGIKGVERSKHRQMRRHAQVGQQASRRNADVRDVVPDRLLGGVVVREEVSPLRLEAVVAHHRGQAFEVGCDGVEDTGTKRGALCDIRRVELHEPGYVGISRLGPPDVLEVLGKVLVREGLELGDQGEDGALIAHVADDQRNRGHLPCRSQAVRGILQMLAVGTDGPR